MDPREKLYRDIRETITERVKVVQHVGLWNEDVAFAEEDSSWPRPAVFVEFGEITWSTVKPTADGHVARGSGDLRLHVVTDWEDDDYEENFTISEDIWVALESIPDCVDYQVRYPSISQTNHSHMELLENVDVFRVVYQKIW